MIKKLLIANRGEIAVRVARTARAMGIRTVAVYSDADRDSMHVAACDEAVRIGPPAARDSYLVIDAILDAAKQTGADAVHPGYGFLSENATFAEACEKAGLIFVGPPVSAIRAMGSKAEAKRIMEKAAVPLVPGYHGADQDPQLLAKEAERIGFPVLLKAAMGGGGKGIRVVEQASELLSSIELVQREAQSAFGDSSLIIERFVGAPRHVEVQVFADSHGNVVHLYERDCSLQRRHQKVIEEAPAPNVPDAARRTMHEAAIAAAKAIGYEGAGTVEFLLGQDGGVFFMEMNTRLQVEHPVTEMVTGLDLVEWQLRVAAGETLPLSQDAIVLYGHAVEARLYAEDPSRDFLPSIGTLEHLSLPAEVDGVRIDTGVRQGDRISPYYDPMIAKLIVHGADRAEAFAKLAVAMEQSEIEGVRTNSGLLGRLARDPSVASMNIDTHFVERLLATPEENAAPLADYLPVLAALHVVQARPTGNDPWDVTDGWRLNLPAEDSVTLNLGGTVQTLRVIRGSADIAWEIDGRSLRPVAAPAGRIAAEIDGRLRTAQVVPNADGFVLVTGSQRLVATVPDLLAVESAGVAGGGLLAPMPGTVVAIEVAVGDKIEAGKTILVLEAMKVHLPIPAPANGTIKEFFVQIGDQVADGARLLAFEAD